MVTEVTQPYHSAMSLRPKDLKAAILNHRLQMLIFKITDPAPHPTLNPLKQRLVVYF